MKSFQKYKYATPISDILLGDGQCPKSVSFVADGEAVFTSWCGQTSSYFCFFTTPLTLSTDSTWIHIRRSELLDLVLFGTLICFHD
jgi:hypothetical protein